jgi:hypothetical protein
MRKKSNPTITAHLIRSAFYLFSLLAICAIPFALAQRNGVRQNRQFQEPLSQSQLVPISDSGQLPDPACTPSYTFTLKVVPFVSGVTDIGNHCDNCGTLITMPFPVTLYDQTFTSATAGSNGQLSFGTPYDDSGITCSPFGNTTATYVMAPYWADQCTSNCGNTACTGCGIFTTTTGTAPDRIFYIEFRTQYFNQTTDVLDYEIALYENGTPPFRYIYNHIVPAPVNNDSQLVIGVKQDDAVFTQYSCDASGGRRPPRQITRPCRRGKCRSLSATFLSCATPTPTPTTTATPTTSATPTGTPTPTPCDSGMIQNGGFETGSFPPWVILDQNASPVVTNLQAHSGTFSGFVGDAPDGLCGFADVEPNGDSSFYQQLTVPVVGGTLSFWHWDCTSDTIDFDWQDAYITDSNGIILQTIFHQCLDTEAWVNQTVDMTPYAGQIVRIEFLVHEDDFGDLTGMFVDDVQLLEPCGTPTPTPIPTATPTATPTGTPAVTPRPAPTPRPRPTPTARPTP